MGKFSMKILKGLQLSLSYLKAYNSSIIFPFCLLFNNIYLTEENKPSSLSQVFFFSLESTTQKTINVHFCENYLFHLIKSNIKLY